MKKIFYLLFATFLIFITIPVEYIHAQVAPSPDCGTGITKTFTASSNPLIQNNSNTLEVNVTGLSETGDLWYTIEIWDTGFPFSNRLEYSAQVNGDPSITYEFANNGVNFQGDKEIWLVRQDSTEIVNFPGNDCLLGNFTVEAGESSCQLSIAPNTCGGAGDTFTVTVSNALFLGNPLSSISLRGSGGGSQGLDLDASGNGSIQWTFTNPGTYTIEGFPPTGSSVALNNCITPEVEIYDTPDLCATPTPTPGAGTPTASPTPIGGVPTPLPAYDPCSGLSLDGKGTEGAPGLETEWTNCTQCQAQNGTYTALGCIPNDPSRFASSFVQILFSISGGIAFLLILYGSFLCLTSRGSTERTQACQETITSAIVGLLLIIFSLFIIRFLFSAGGIFPDLVPSVLFF